MAAAAAKARAVVLPHAWAVFAMTFGLDTSVPNMARVYNYWLGGKDHFAADRAEAERLVALYPPLPALFRENRAFLLEAAGWAARQGIGQFIDLGAGLPVSPPVHQAARAVLPAARVAPHQGLVPTSGPPCVQDTPRHAQDAACQLRYNNANAFVRYSSYTDPDSWQCWGLNAAMR